jgi:hypothetical protein
MSTDSSLGKSKTGRKRPVKEKPTFEQFIASFQEVLSGTDRKALAKALKLLKTGFSEIQKDHGRSEEIFAIVRSWKLVDPLSVRLSMDCRFGKINTPAKILWERLRTDFVREIGYPMIPAGEGDGGRTPISEWIKMALRSLPTDPEGWLRRAFVCILGEGDPENIREYLYILLDEYHLQVLRKGRTKESVDRDFITLVASSLGKTGQMKTSVKQFAMTARPARSMVREAVIIAERCRAEVLEARQDLREQEEGCDQLKIDLEKANAQIGDLKRENQEKEAKLRSETDRCKAVEIHWRETLRSETARLSSRVRERLSHEVNETELCLGRENPNVSMALDRIRRIREYLENLGGE